MGLFGKKKSNEPKSVPPQEEAVVNLLSQHIGTARLFQQRFADVIESNGKWDVDFDRGVIRFGHQEYGMGFIGSESNSGNTWLWGTENINGFPEPVIRDVNGFFNSGLLDSAPALKQAKLPLDEWVTGHNLSSLVIASGKVKQMCYYRCGYDGGAAFVLVNGLPPSVFAPAQPTELAGLIPGLLAEAEWNHRLLIMGLLQNSCEAVQEGDGLVKGKFADGNTLRVEFDEKDRVTSVRLAAGGQPEE